jgi:hypothetical protein
VTSALLLLDKILKQKPPWNFDTGKGFSMATISLNSEIQNEKAEKVAVWLP